MSYKVNKLFDQLDHPFHISDKQPLYSYCPNAINKLHWCYPVTSLHNNASVLFIAEFHAVRAFVELFLAAYTHQASNPATSALKSKDLITLRESNTSHKTKLIVYKDNKLFDIL